MFAFFFCIDTAFDAAFIFVSIIQWDKFPFPGNVITVFIIKFIENTIHSKLLPFYSIGLIRTIAGTYNAKDKITYSNSNGS